jgi:HAD superfamily hydrolase (TIGR01509 family)
VTPGVPVTDLATIQAQVDDRVDAIVFDCDGVVVDSVGPTHRAIAAVLETRGLTLTEAEALGLPRIETIQKEIESAYMEAVRGNLRVMPGAMVMVGSLSARMLCALASSSSRRKNAFTLSQVGFSGAFSVIVTADEVAKPKPAPDVLELACVRMNVDPVNVLVVDDAPVGIEAAVKIGAIAIGYTSTVPRAELEAAGADYVIDTLQELRVLLRKKGRET